MTSINFELLALKYILCNSVHVCSVVVVSLVRPRPPTRKNGLVNRVKFLV